MARIALAKLEAKLVGEMDAHFRLKDRLDPIRDGYEFIVIDCPPTLGLLTANRKDFEGIPGLTILTLGSRRPG